jgi:phosphoribosyl 1,2-cyclic phosphodiesterase
MNNQFSVKFWGVRGSIPTPGNTTIRYGGNTSCIQIRIGEKNLIFDAGTGLRNLSKSLPSDVPLELHLFFTHYHWDHIQGIPFFEPFFEPNNIINIYGRVPEEMLPLSLKDHFYQKVLHVNSPVPVKEIEAQLQFHELVCGQKFTLDDLTLETRPLNHPNGAMGYRLTWANHSIVYCTDTEHFPDRLDDNILYLAHQADLLIYDSMYTDDEYHNPKSPKMGWGHSTWQEAVKIAKEAEVKKLAIFHHEPSHNDDILDQIGREAKQSFENSFIAFEGLEVAINNCYN